MRVLIFGENTDCKQISDYLNNYGSNIYTHTNNPDELLHKLAVNSFDLIIIISDGAFGMERVIAARKLCPDTTLFWFSNDKDFGAQAYRLNCNYFSTKPVTDQKLDKAIKIFKAKAG